MTKFLREPLLHFLLLGAGLFVLFVLVDDEDDADTNNRIEITTGRVESLREQFAKVWQRQPLEQEVAGLIQEYIKDEVLYREALAMGLDANDAMVRRRMRQKVEFLSEDLAVVAEPTEEELQTFLAVHAEHFREEARFSFSQVYLNATKRGSAAESDALALLSELRGGADAETAGDRLTIPFRFEQAPGWEISREMGQDFVNELGRLKAGDWEGPVRSGFGLHLVRISEKTEGAVPELAKVREAVQKEWSEVMREKFNDDFYQSLLERYEVTIETWKVVPPDEGTGDAPSSAE